jgi:hypothetical protein
MINGPNGPTSSLQRVKRSSYPHCYRSGGMICALCCWAIWVVLENNLPSFKAGNREILI